MYLFFVHLFCYYFSFAFKSRRKIQGLELILKSINCEKYKSQFENHGINEQTLILLSEDDLRRLGVDNSDIYTILNAINILNKTLKHSEIRLS